jgi:hypothetical protein
MQALQGTKGAILSRGVDEEMSEFSDRAKKISELFDEANAKEKKE